VSRLEAALPTLRRVSDLLVYRVSWVVPGRPSQTSIYESRTPLEVGHWISVNGAFLVVERVVPGKRGDAYDGVALCRLAQG